MANRPDWWPAWLPERDDAGHELAPGAVSISWVFCDCPGALGGGHNVYHCRKDCRQQHWPPEHTGPKRNQR